MVIGFNCMGDKKHCQLFLIRCIYCVYIDQSLVCTIDQQKCDKNRKFLWNNNISLFRVLPFSEQYPFSRFSRQARQYFDPLFLLGPATFSLQP